MTVSFDGTPVSSWGMKMHAWDISSPEPKVTYVSVPGRDGDLDFTESLDGIVRYNSRTISLTLSLDGGYSNWFQTVKSFSSFLHGRKRKLVFSDDPGYSYIGRFTVTAVKENGVTGDITVSGTCTPYKLKNEKTVVEAEVTETAELTLTNEQKPVIPVVTTDADMQLVFHIGGTEHTVTAGAGSQMVPELLLQSGSYSVTVNGTGHVKFEYQEGAL